MHALQTCFLLLVISSLFSCAEPGPACRLGDPVAIFNESLEDVQTHRFSHEGRNAEEYVSFSNGLNVEIHQSGCEQVRQEFRFQLPERGPDASDTETWARAASNMYFFLGSQGIEYQVFQEWGGIIDQQAAQFVRGEPREVHPGFWVEIDPVQTETSTMLRVVLAQGE